MFFRGFEKHDVEAFGRTLRALPEAALLGAAAGLYQEAEAIMTDSKEIVPFDLGVLSDSGFVDPWRDGDTVYVMMGYGGAAAAYALIQHEDLTLRHPNGREAKYLEKPLMARVPDMSSRIGEHVMFRMKTVLPP